MGQARYDGLPEDEEPRRLDCPLGHDSPLPSAYGIHGMSRRASPKGLGILTPPRIWAIAGVSVS